MTLLSLYGIIIFSNKLLNPKNFEFFLYIILCNKDYDYKKEYESSLKNKNNIYMNNLHYSLTDKKENDMNKYLNDLTYGIISESLDEKNTSFDLGKKSPIKLGIDIKEKNKENIDIKAKKTTLMKNIKDSRKNSLLKNKNDISDFHNNEKKSFEGVIDSFCNFDNNVQNKKNDNLNKDYDEHNQDFMRKNSFSFFDLLTYNLEIQHMLQRMIAISISINNDRIYDNKGIYQEYYFSPLPWKNTNPNFYKEKTPFVKYTNKNIPKWLDIKDSKIFNDIEFDVLSYSPFVFHHLRLLDKFSIDEILKSLDPKKNLQMVHESKEILKRGGNSSMILSWDKKLIIKTISKNEKYNFIHKMLEEYHYRMRDTKSILSHIYGVFKIKIGNKESNVILQRNMNDLFLKSNILTFDLNGETSTDRQTIKPGDKNLKQNLLFKKYKYMILKDNDLKITKMEIELNPYDGKNILLSICNDSIFLQKYNVIDYSLLIFVNKYNKKNFEKHLGNPRIMPDYHKKYIFNFSIVDYLDTYNFEKKSSKLVTNLVGSVLKVPLDNNFSTEDPQIYGINFRKFAKKIIIYEKEDNDNGNFSS
jgi:hypothetical protein